MQLKDKKLLKNLVFGVLLKVIFFFTLNIFIASDVTYSQCKEPGKRRPNISIRFDFDKRLKERPYRVYLRTEEEVDTETWVEPNRFQFYERGKTSYDFFNIKPGVYWVGLSFRYLKKDWRVIEWVFVEPGIATGLGELTYNRIDVTINKRVVIDLKVKLASLGSVNDVEDHSENPLRIVKRARPKTSEEQMMLDENFTDLGAGFFDGAKQVKSKYVDHKKVFFSLYVFDEYLSDRYK